VNHHEMNSKRLKEKLVRSENEMCQKEEEVVKMRNKLTHAKAQIQKQEYMEKKLRTLVFNKETVIQQTQLAATKPKKRKSSSKTGASEGKKTYSKQT